MHHHGKTSDKIQCLLLVTFLSQLGMKEHFLILIKSIYENLAGNVRFTSERRNAYPLRWERNKGAPLTTSVQLVLVIFKKIKNIQVGKEKGKCY